MAGMIKETKKDQEITGIRCPKCNQKDTKVITTRSIKEGIKRYRICNKCGRNFCTIERE